MTVNSQSRSLITTDHSERKGGGGREGHGWNVIVGLSTTIILSREFFIHFICSKGKWRRDDEKSFALKIHCNVIEGGEMKALKHFLM